MNKTAQAYREIFEILDIFPIEMVALIPMDVIEYFINNMDRDYDCHFEPSTFRLEDTLEETRNIFAALYIAYWMPRERGKKFTSIINMRLLKRMQKITKRAQLMMF